MRSEGPEQARLLVIDDDENVGRLAVRLLERAGYSCTLATCACEARRAFDATVDLAFCDVGLGGESGLELAQELAQDHPETAIVMMSGRNDAETVGAALELGVYGYIVKPFVPAQLVVSARNALRRRTLERESLERRWALEAAVEERTATLRQTVARLEHSEEQTRRSRAEAIERLAAAVESRDADTGRHGERISALVEDLARDAGVDEERRRLLRLASLLHDVGKLAIPDRILFKRGALTERERSVVETHAEHGHRILTGSDSELLVLAATIALTHHERFDGTGYPRALVGEEIPLEGRLVAIADAWDALTSDRPYRPAYSAEEAAAIMIAQRAQFDPRLLERFLDRVTRRGGTPA